MWLKNGARLFEVPEASDLAERLVGEGFQSVDGPNADIAHETSEPSAVEALRTELLGKTNAQLKDRIDAQGLALVGSSFTKADLIAVLLAAAEKTPEA